MKRILFVFILLITSLHSFCQDWTEAQLDAADTGKDIPGISDTEKDAILYINLARLYPQLFLKNELENYTGVASVGENVKNSSYKKSLMKQLKTLAPMNALIFDNDLYQLGQCFAKEIGVSGAVTHKRKKCPYGYLAECCSFGMDTGKDIAMQWLIDDKVPGLGHRINCLEKNYTMIGIAVQKHKVYKICAVADFR